ncbi:hypothetical protein [Phenylobacterium sp.]|uniref:hypothetical protein n=1 Tax=Phenylobacterium sp. TaxID=1871053 RepID=UPI001221DC28|nr:hypothetical protein [Phenylobacterium sp.]THD60822.1 MAG: hypothetical protein E8A49_12635 [Phenylobacterium sp.]
MTARLPVDCGDLMSNDWEIIGNFMYRPSAFQTLVGLVRPEILDLGKVNIERVSMVELPDAMARAATMRGLDCTVVDLA